MFYKGIDFRALQFCNFPKYAKTCKLRFYKFHLSCLIFLRGHKPVNINPSLKREVEPLYAGDLQQQ